MGGLEIQDVFAPYYDRDGKAKEPRQAIDGAGLKRRHQRIARRGEAKPRDTEIHVARDVEHRG